LSIIQHIGLGLPPFRHEQDQIRSYMHELLGPNEQEKRLLNILYQKSGIQHRYSILSEFSKKPAARFSIPDSALKERFFPPFSSLSSKKKSATSVTKPGTRERMERYQTSVLPLAIEAIGNLAQQWGFVEEKKGIQIPGITHLITVSCTGLQAPGLDTELCRGLQLPPGTQRHTVQFMGCYAAVHALRLAHLIQQQDPKSVILIVCVELCTLHLQYDLSPDAITSGMLFGDGAAALLVHGKDYAKKYGQHKKPAIQLEGFYGEVFSDHRQDMTWELGNEGFLMKLTPAVPTAIEKNFPSFFQRAAQKQKFPKKPDYWCVHPGGPKILEAVQKSMKITSDQLQASWEVMKEYGNMSSPTILFVLDKILQQAKQNVQEKTSGKEKKGEGKVKKKKLGSSIVGAAFGPGLTLESFTASLV